MRFNIVLKSGAEIEIPDRLANYLRTAHLVDFESSETSGIVTDLQLSLNPMAIAENREITSRQSHLSSATNIVEFGRLGYKKTQEVISLGQTLLAFGLLVDYIHAIYQAWAFTEPELMGELTHLLLDMIEAVIILGTQISIMDDARATDDLDRTFAVMTAVWDPTLNYEAHRMQLLLRRFAEVAQSKPQNRAAEEDLLHQLMSFKAEVIKKRNNSNKYQHQLDLILNMIDHWNGALQAQMIAPFTPISQDPNSLSQNTLVQVQTLIGEVEQRLREAIAYRYAKQFGNGWVQHIQAKHSSMYENWLRNMEKDRAAFSTYEEYSPKILEYAQFGDLSDLITAQWQLFRTLFDFGYADKNKMFFVEKMNQIARIRNPLAHHRTIPENELLRALVLCTDILLCLKRDGKANADSLKNS